MNTSKSCFIIGLPAAGKTSYLAALAYSLEQQNIPTKLQWKSFSGNQQYLTKLAEKWLTAEPVDRTSFSLEQRSLSWCLSDDDDNKYNISFPDLSGETFQKQYVDREIDSVLAKMIIASDGLILFINPQGIIEPTLISQLPLSLREDEKNDTSPKERNQKIDDPTVVQIIVLLQDIAYLLMHNLFYQSFCGPKTLSQVIFSNFLSPQFTHYWQTTKWSIINGNSFQIYYQRWHGIILGINVSDFVKRRNNEV